MYNTYIVFCEKRSKQTTRFCYYYHTTKRRMPWLPPLQAAICTWFSLAWGLLYCIYNYTHINIPIQVQNLLAAIASDSEIMQQPCGITGYSCADNKQANKVTHTRTQNALTKIYTLLLLQLKLVHIKTLYFLNNYHSTRDIHLHLESFYYYKKGLKINSNSYILFCFLCFFFLSNVCKSKSREIGRIFWER